MGSGIGRGRGYIWARWEGGSRVGVREGFRSETVACDTERDSKLGGERCYVCIRSQDIASPSAYP